MENNRRRDVSATGCCETQQPRFGFINERVVLDFKGVGTGGTADDQEPGDEGELETLLVQGDAGERAALRLGECGDEIDAATERALAAEECS